MKWIVGFLSLIVTYGGFLWLFFIAPDNGFFGMSPECCAIVLAGSVALVGAGWELFFEWWV